MSLFKNKWFSKLTGKGKQEQAEKDAAELAAKEQAEKDAAELAAKEQAEKDAAELAANEHDEKEYACGERSPGSVVRRRKSGAGHDRDNVEGGFPKCLPDADIVVCLVGQCDRYDEKDHDADEPPHLFVAEQQKRFAAHRLQVKHEGHCPQ